MVLNCFCVSNDAKLNVFWAHIVKFNCMKVSIVVAIAENGVIGIDNGLPWRLSSDLKNFKKLTSGHTILMGRKTYESIGKPLPKRRNLVISRDPAYIAEGCEVFQSIEVALEAAKADSEVFVIGGAQIYRQVLPKADKIYLTRVKAEVKGDAFFEIENLDQWQVVSTQAFAAGEKDEYDFEVVELLQP